MKILVAEDDDYLAGAIVMALQHLGYNVDLVNSGFEVKGALAACPYDLLLLDLGLPDIDGTQVLREIRRQGDQLPVMIITARHSIEDKINGLDQGANDYLTKPFDFREFKSRVRALLRKNVWGNCAIVTCGRLRFDVTTKELFLDDGPIRLTPGEVTILEALLKKPGRLVKKTDLIDYLAKWDASSSENAIEIIVHRLRRKLELSDAKIQTVRGFGYLIKIAN